MFLKCLPEVESKLVQLECTPSFNLFAVQAYGFCTEIKLNSTFRITSIEVRFCESSHMSAALKGVSDNGKDNTCSHL
jgi:hypothetical protein